MGARVTTSHLREVTLPRRGRVSSTFVTQEVYKPGFKGLTPFLALSIMTTLANIYWIVDSIIGG
jgi:hypothetical protein